jgi:hypothetical protein
MISVEFQAGPGTIAEAMIRGLPIILNGYIAGQVFSLATHCRDCFIPLLVLMVLHLALLKYELSEEH